MCLTVFLSYYYFGYLDCVKFERLISLLIRALMTPVYIARMNVLIFQGVTTNEITLKVHQELMVPYQFERHAGNRVCPQMNQRLYFQ